MFFKKTKILLVKELKQIWHMVSFKQVSIWKLILNFYRKSFFVRKGFKVRNFVSGISHSNPSLTYPLSPFLIFSALKFTQTHCIIIIVKLFCIVFGLNLTRPVSFQNMFLSFVFRIISTLSEILMRSKWRRA